MLSFYGVAGLTLALYNWLTISWDVGSGFNEYNKEARPSAPPPLRRRSPAPGRCDRSCAPPPGVLPWRHGVNPPPQEGVVRIFRLGFPGKDRRINLTSPIKDVRASGLRPRLGQAACLARPWRGGAEAARALQAVRVEVKEGLNPRRVLYLCIKVRRGAAAG